MAKFNTVIFDMDGTLFNSEDLALRAANDAMDKISSKHQMQPLSSEDIRDALGMTSKDYYATLYASLSDEDQKKAKQICNQLESQYVKEHLGSLFPDVIETLEILKKNNISLNLATNSCLVYMEAITQFYNFPEYMDIRLCADSKNGMTKTEMISDIMKQTKKPHVMVGDRYFDQRAAADNNIPFICCDYGYCDISHNTDVDILRRINNISEIVNIVL